MNILLTGANGKMGNIIQSLSNSQFNIFAGIDKNFININNLNTKNINNQNNYDNKQQNVTSNNGNNVINNNNVIFSSNNNSNNNLLQFNNFKSLPNEIINQIDIVLDFCMPNILTEELNFCKTHNKPLVICSTGHSEKQLLQIQEYSKYIPILKTTNTSIGIAIINKMLQSLKNFCNDYKSFIVEKHHIHKKDAPSGTAKTLIQNLNNLGFTPECYSLRAGTCTGEHQIILMGKSEQITLTHTAESRELFAYGALKLCEYLSLKPKGKLYSMEDFLSKNLIS